MPQKINMVISNGNTFPQIQQIPQIPINNSNVPVLKRLTALNSSMITRIQGVKSGCGGCGRSRS